MSTLLRRLLDIARWLVRLEVGIWRSLFLWAARRRPGRRAGVEAFPYTRDLAPLMAAFILGSALELVVVHLLLPWEHIRLAADILGVWGLLWMLGYLASVRVFPHLLADGELRVRYGATADIAVPLELIADVSTRRRRVATRKTVSVQRGDEHGVVATVAVLRQTNIDVTLLRPTKLDLPDGTHECTELRLYADKPGALVTAVRRRLTARHP